MKFLQTVKGILLAKYFRRPFYVRFQVNYRCNYRCRMCSTYNRPVVELDLEQIAVVARRLAELGAKHAVLTGGEPFLRDDLPQIIALFARQGFSIRVQTNGGPHLKYEQLKRCVEAGLQDLSVSIDTLDPALQDSITRTKNVVHHALKTLGWAKELMPWSISQANVVASEHNFAELPSLVRFFHAKGIYTYITPAMNASEKAKQNGDYIFRSSDPAFRPAGLPSDLRERVIDELLELRRRDMGLTNSSRFLRDYRQSLVDGSAAWRCEAGTLSLDILPDGGVAVCKEKPPLGNILDPDFIRRFRSAAFANEACRVAEACTLGCFYGEYREPMYAVRDSAVLREWAASYLRNYRYGMRGMTAPCVDNALPDNAAEVGETVPSHGVVLSVVQDRAKLPHD